MGKAILHLLIIGIVGFLTYANTFNAPFHFDDIPNIAENSNLRNLSNFWPPKGSRWLGFFTFALNYKLCGLDVTGYHILNLAIHILNSILVYRLVILTLRMHDTRYTIHDKGNTPLYPPLARGELKGGIVHHASWIVHHHLIALFSALIFVSHPIQTQAVTYIYQRFTSLATFFYLLSLVMYIEFRIHDTKKMHDAGYTIHDRGNTPLSPPLIRGELRGGIVHHASYIMYLASLFSAVLAMKTKEIAFTLPFVITLYEFMFFPPSPLPSPTGGEGKNIASPLRGGDKGEGDLDDSTNELFSKRRFLYLLPFFMILIIIPLSLTGSGSEIYKFEVGAEEGLRQSQMRELITLSKYDYLLTQFRVLGTYIRLLFLPVNQNLDYDYPIYNSFLNADVFLSFLFLTFVLGLGVYLFYRSRPRYMIHDTRYTIPPFNSPLTKGGHRGVSRITHHVSRIIVFGILWFFITLSVESSVIPIKDVIFEHRLYLPSIGIIIAFGTALLYVLQNAKRTTVRQCDSATKKSSSFTFISVALPLYCSIALIVVLSIATFHRNVVWGSGVSLWEDVVKKSPLKERGHYNLGNEYKTMGLFEKAITEYESAIRFGIRPWDLSDDYNNLGIIYAKKRLLDRAITMFEEAVRLNPHSSLARKNLGLAYREKVNNK